MNYFLHTRCCLLRMIKARLFALLLAIGYASFLNSDALPIEHQLSFQELFNRSDLICNKNCDTITCCVCNNRLQVDNIQNLEIHNIGNNKSLLEIPNIGQKIFDNSVYWNYDMYSVFYVYRNLTSLPVNLCDFPSLVTIDFKFNDISEIDSISCVSYLDTLILRGNKVEHLTNRTFLDLKFIRIIDLSYNNLKLLDPGFLINVAGNLFHFDVSHNELDAVDITNVVWTKQEYFCLVDFSHNRIKTVTNQLQWKNGPQTNFGRGGFVDCEYNELSDFRFFSEIGFDYKQINVLGKLFDYGFDLRENKWVCDCAFYPFAILAPLVVRNIERNYFDVKCFSPPNLRNKSILEIIKDKHFDLLICNISVSQKCPLGCSCFYQPSASDRTVVNCSNTPYTRLPSHLPENNHLEVDFTNGSISELTLKDKNRSNSTYFSRIMTLILKNNKIKIIPDEFPYLLAKAKQIDLTGNQITQIPRSFQIFRPCQVHIGLVYKDCECEDLWLQQWLPSEGEKCSNNLKIMCNVKGKYIPIGQLLRQDLGCRIKEDFLVWTSYLIGILLLFSCLLISILFSFRCEFYIIVRNSIKNFRNIKPSCVTEFDVYISCNEEDDGIRVWLTSFLVPFLEDKQLKVFLPFRDVAFGVLRQEEIIDKISASRNVIIILSEENHKMFVWNQMEWKQAWEWYKTDLSREIIVVNFDMLNSSEISQGYLRAFLRLYKVIDFSNHKHDIGENILGKLNADLIGNNYTLATDFQYTD